MSEHSPNNQSPEQQQPDHKDNGSSSTGLVSTDQINQEIAQDVALTRRRFSIKTVLTWLCVVLFLLFLLVAGLVAFVSTDRGTQYFLDTVSDVADIDLTYDKGNVVSGLWVKDLAIPINKNSTIYADKVRIKMGWRQLFDKDIVHLRDAYIHELKLQDVNPPSGKPFRYFQINLPAKLVLSKAKVDRFVYAKATRKDLVLTDVTAKDLNWTDDKLSLRDGTVTYGKYARLNQLAGSITFKDKWPITAAGDLTVPILSRQQFSEFDAQVSGTLAELHADLTGKWQSDTVTGKLVAYPVEKRLPYRGVFEFENISLPYLQSQSIKLDDGALAVKGNLNQTFLGLDANIQGKDIPKGRYLASGRTDFIDIQFNQVTANTQIGKAAGSGYVGWKQGLVVNFDGQVKNIKPRRYISASARQYVPESMTGLVKVNLKQPKQRGSSSAPLRINTKINQTTGDAFYGDVVLVNNRIASVTGQLTSQKLPQLPKGSYDIDLDKSANVLTIKRLNYLGELGQLNATAGVALPTESNNATQWQAHVTNANLNLARFNAALPVNRIMGDVRASGRMLGSLHDIDIDAADVSTQLVQQDNAGKTHRRELSILGQGKTGFRLSNGNLSNVSAQFAGRMNTAGLPLGSMVFDIAQQGNRWQINRFVHQSADGSLNASGEVGLGNGANAPVTWNVSGKLNNFNPAVFMPAYSGRLSGDVITQGQWSSRAQRIVVDRMNLAGMLKGKPLTATGKLKLDLALPASLSGVRASQVINAFYADDFRLGWANNQVVATGSHEQVDLMVDVSTLHQLYSGITGKLKGTVTVTNPKSRAPDANVNLTAQAFELGNMTVNQGKIVGQLNGLGQQASELAVNLVGVKLANTKLHALDLKALGTQAQHEVTFSAQHQKADIQGLLTGGLTSKQGIQWQGNLSQGQLRSDLLTLNQQQPAVIGVNTTNNQYRVSAHCWRSQQANGSFCLDRPLDISKNGGMVYASLKSLDSAFFAPFLPKGMAWKGKLQGDTRLNWQRGKSPQINAVFYTDNGTIGLEADDPQDKDTTLAYKRLSLILASHTKGLKVRMDAKTQTAGNGYIDAVIDPKHPDKTINGAMVLDDIHLDVFRPFFTGVRKLEGTVSLAGGMSGPLMGPQYYGNLKLKNGAVAMLGLPVNLNNINITSLIRGTKATVTGDFLSGEGKGKGKLTGSADWKNSLAINLKLAGERLALRHAPVLYAEVNPDITFDLMPYQRRLGIAGNVDVVKGTLRAPDSDPNVITQSGDVVVIRDEMGMSGVNNKDAEQQAVIDPQVMKKALAASAAWKINTNVTVNIAKDTYFNGFGASIPLTGKVNVKQSGRGRTQGFGSINIGKRVPVTVFGQSLDLTRGKVQFAGNIAKPTLDIEAVRKVSGDEIGVRVEGSADQPKIEVFNDAGLTEQQAMNALVTGRIEGAGNTTTETFQDGVNNAIAAAGLSVGLRGTRSFTNRIGRNFGLSGLTLDASGSDNDTNLNITGYLTPDLYLRYGVGVFTPVNKLTMRYQLSKRVYVEASSAIEKAIDVFYNWRF